MQHLEIVHIIFVLDRSGSMRHLRAAAVAGLNAFLVRQQETTPQARVTLVLFADMVQTICQNAPLSEAHLDASDYQPGGETALYDAVGSTIDQVGLRFARLPHQERPKRVLFAILTDGEENSSRGYSALDVQWRLRRQAEVYGWEFIFLGASQNWLGQATELGIPEQAAMQFKATPEGLHEVMVCASEIFADKRGWVG